MECNAPHFYPVMIELSCTDSDSCLVPNAITSSGY